MSFARTKIRKGFVWSGSFPHLSTFFAPIREKPIPGGSDQSRVDVWRQDPGGSLSLEAFFDHLPMVEGHHFQPGAKPSRFLALELPLTCAFANYSQSLP